MTDNSDVLDHTTQPDSVLSYGRLLGRYRGNRVRRFLQNVSELTGFVGDAVKSQQSRSVELATAIRHSQADESTWPLSFVIRLITGDSRHRALGRLAMIEVKNMVSPRLSALLLQSNFGPELRQVFASNRRRLRLDGVSKFLLTVDVIFRYVDTKNHITIWVQDVDDRVFFLLVKPVRRSSET